MNDMQTINVMKGLVIDGVNQAKSGHPGGAMSSMDFAYLLFTEFLQYDPDSTQWLGRDRFILSAGHESMLLYTLLHMQGFLPLSELKRFRQLHSKTPGHPENFITPGVECTTGPLGQGAAMAVGFAMAAAHHRARFGAELFDQHIWVLMGDGCMQEDVTLGAASLAGHLKLDNMIWFYDQNKIQISGHIDRAFSDDTGKVFEGFGWNVIYTRGHNLQELRSALTQARQHKGAPTLIIGDTIMAHGAFSMEGEHDTHGSPLPAEERTKTKEKLGLPAEDFYCPPEAVQHFQRLNPQRRQKVQEWKKALEQRKAKDADFAKLWRHCFEQEDFSTLPTVTFDKAVATRNAFGDVLAKWASALPNLMGGSADLEPSNMTGAFAKAVGDFTAKTPINRNIAFGVREFPMSAIANGLALFGGIIPFDATFLTFSDYSRPALRLGALQRARVIHEFTHDSFYLGEDGPTHQAVEHVMSLRLIPNFYVMRPADANETEVMMRAALKLKTNSAICLSRQKLPLLPVPLTTVQQAAKGAYVVHDHPKPEMLIMATGSEVSLAVEAARKIGGAIRVISMPCWELFDEQPRAYREEVMPSHVTKRVSIEAGVTTGWQKYTYAQGLNIGLDRFGDSAPAEELAKEYGFTVDAVVERIRQHTF